MVVVLVTPRAEQAEVWRSGLAELLGDIEFRVWAEDHFDRFFCFRPQTLDTAR